jgi:hypothetical protein
LNRAEEETDMGFERIFRRGCYPLFDPVAGTADVLCGNEIGEGGDRPAGRRGLPDARSNRSRDRAQTPMFVEGI